ncbi:hypothetical protein [Variovorax arabinosiphilus]|uniref:hypothetical protein n=1 Tax=Variovorax arabinosiphilus TaxID=3053498 RepID=UPI0025788D8D|nr:MULTISPECIES: hypothetical protein [unclassified Variovorax]MDM0118867.1 hypothetical protein [Variovorax sp. J2L1-78]MDM0129292.1 hypothetical protein [Variovorax sp. J2L1-63]MDM0232921.1 hypothetical protein [Variovorax sp. J2R1-6]
MDNKIPLPTDNIYKFYALFGLLLFVFGIGVGIAQTKSSNDFMVKSYVELETLRSIEKPTAVEIMKKAFVERLIAVESENKVTFKWGLTVISAAGLVLMGYGFHRWHTRIQPAQDEMVRLQLEKLRRDLTPHPERTRTDGP